MAKILFYQRIWWELIGLMSISTVLKKSGHECTVFFGNRERFFKEIKSYKPNLIGFSCMNAQIAEAVSIAAYLKENGVNIPIILGGVYPTLYPEIIYNHALDYISIGESEETLLELMNAIDGGKDSFQDIRGLGYKKEGKVYRNAFRPRPQDLDSIGFLDRSIYYEKYRFFSDAPCKFFMFSRGCIYRCGFCCNHVINSLYPDHTEVRYRSPESMIDEILFVKKRYGLKGLYFEDDMFALDKKRLFTLLDLYKGKVRIPFWCNIRADYITEDLAGELYRANCKLVEMGTETGNENLRNIILRKELRDSQIIKAVETLKKYHIRVRVNNIYGLPTETFEDAVSTINFTRRLKPDYLGATIFQPYPKLFLTSFAMEEKVLPSVKPDKMDIHYNRQSALRQKDIKKICNLHKFSYLLIKFPLLMRLVKKIIRLPPNPLFNIIHDLSYGMNHYFQFKGVSGVGLVRFAKEIIKNYDNV